MNESTPNPSSEALHTESTTASELLDRIFQEMQELNTPVLSIPVQTPDDEPLELLVALRNILYSEDRPDAPVLVADGQNFSLYDRNNLKHEDQSHE